MPDLSRKTEGSFSLAAWLMSQSLCMRENSRRAIACRRHRGLCQREMDGFEGEPPFVRPTARSAIAAGRRGLPVPTQHLIERSTEQRFFSRDLGDERVGVAQIRTHEGIAVVPGDRPAIRAKDRVA